MVKAVFGCHKIDALTPIRSRTSHASSPTGSPISCKEDTKEVARELGRCRGASRGPDGSREVNMESTSPCMIGNVGIRRGA